MDRSQFKNPGLMTVDEVAVKLRVKRSWVYAHADDLGVFRLGKYLRFSWPRVLDHLAGGPSGQPPESLTDRGERQDGHARSGAS